MADWKHFDTRISLASLASGDVASIPRIETAGEILTRAGHRYQVMFNGLHMRADGYYGPWMTEMISRLRGFHEPQEEKVFHVVLGEPDNPQTMLKLRGYWGWYSLSARGQFL